MSSTDAEILAQKAANASSVPHYDAFREHREHLTDLVCRAASTSGERRLCVLGAGNCNDLELEAITARYAEVHLVDLDEAALERAWDRQSDAVRARLVRHAPVDVSGAFDRLERWAAGDVGAEEWVRFAGGAADALHVRLGGSFDTVLSACVLTQIQLTALHVLGDAHRYFELARYTLALTHLRALSRLTSPGGRAILATDVSSSRIFPFKSLLRGPRRLGVLDQLARAGHIFYVANPSWLASIARDDPTLRRDARLSAPLDVWAWQNGPHDTFLVYACELTPHPRG